MIPLVLLLCTLPIWSQAFVQPNAYCGRPAFRVVHRQVDDERHQIIKTTAATMEGSAGEGSSTSSSSSNDADTASSPSSKTSSRWKNFDYNKHWYPVSWLCDLKPNQPTKVTLFDLDYVIAVNSTTATTTTTAAAAAADTNNIRITALRDICPHKAAALSEGRMTADGTALQCAYHGWTFAGTTGECVQIPQSPPPLSSSSSSSNKKKKNYSSSRTCAQAVPAVLHQGMIWLWPGPKLETTSYPSPPSIPEMDDDSFTVTRVVRDFPVVDWTLLVSNILDPDHGLFAHQTAPFDWYSASVEYPLNVTERYFDDDVHATGWTLQTTVPAVEKLLKVDKERRRVSKEETKKKLFSLRREKKKKTTKTSDDAPPLATSTFYAPTTIALCRRADANAPTKFVTGFWVCPTGTGRSRFFSAAIGVLPIKVPRWIYHLNLNGFLDQDTVLVASQQPAVLSAEAVGKGRCQSGLFAYASPTDRAVRLIDQFWDATVRSAPNRNATLQEMYRTGQLRHTPDRRIVLDRKVQHLDICPDSQDVVRNAKRIRAVSVAAATSWFVACVVQRTILKQYRWVPIVAALTAWVAHTIQRGFYFCYPESNRNRDLKKIPEKMWLDPAE